MESELEKFRRRKQLEEKKEEIKTKFKTTANSWAHSFCQALLPNWNDEEESEDEEDDDKPSSDRDNLTPQQHEEMEASNGKQKWLMYLVIFFRFLAWSLVYVGFLKIGFGAVFFTISLIALIYWNTRQSGGRKRKKGEISAYSVFNKDCQSIDGTLKAEHLEKQLLYRS